MDRLKQNFHPIVVSILNSYSQVFFSNNRVFAAILIVVSFFDLTAGLSGLAAVVVANTTAYVMGFNRFNIQAGYYGFNALLVGLGLGIYYSPGWELLLLLIFISVLTLFFSIMFEGILGKYGLPYLSIPFLLGIWIITLASREFSALSISERGLFLTNDLYNIGGTQMVDLYNWIIDLNIPDVFILYFRSLGAIFFQYTFLAGVLIAIGLLIYSRIAFVLSILGFFSAYLFYFIVGGNIYELSYMYIGFNFILSAIAIGGFFIVPSRVSYLWVILIIPLLVMIITATIPVFSIFQISIYSLPFNLVVLMFLYVLKFRERYYHQMEPVIHQQFSPEKNLYAQITGKERFHEYKFVSIWLPFWGEWEVTQAHHGKYTHKDKWAHAWDFEIVNDEGSKFKNTGRRSEDYYCFDKPVVSPADGEIVEVSDGIADNEIGDMNLVNNWGNTIVIRHAPKVFSKLSHLRESSIKVTKGELVKKGDLLARVGNSGRSPEPHLHFQVQETPFIGSETLDYPLASFVQHSKNIYSFKSFDKPKQGTLVSNIEKNNTLYKAFHFVPGQKLKFEVNHSHQSTEEITWEARADIFNNTFLYCMHTGAKAWYHNDGALHYFTHFDGDQKSLLYYFYLGAYKVSCGYYKNMKIVDRIPIYQLAPKFSLFFHDFIAPFYQYLKAIYSMEFSEIKNYLSESTIGFRSEATVKRGSKRISEIQFEFLIEKARISSFKVIAGKQTIEARELKTQQEVDRDAK